MKMPEEGAPETNQGRQSWMSTSVQPLLYPMDQLGKESSLCLKEWVTILPYTRRSLFLQTRLWLCPRLSRIQGRGSLIMQCLQHLFVFAVPSERG